MLQYTKLIRRLLVVKVIYIMNGKAIANKNKNFWLM